MLILCIAAFASALLPCCLIYCRCWICSKTQSQAIHYNCGLTVKGPTGHLSVLLGGSVVLPCHVQKSLLQKRLKVEWKRTDNNTLVHLYQDGESQAKKQHQDYQGRAHFFTDEIKDGNFSLRLDNPRAEDEGLYRCKVYSGQDCVFSAETDVVLNFIMKSLCGEEIVSLGDSVVLPCHVGKHFLKCLKVEWRRTDTETLVCLYQDGQSRAEEQHPDYQDRAHFITNEIKDGNFSLRLKKVKAEDEGKYTCKVYSQQHCVYSANTTLVLRFDVKCSHHTLAPLGSSVVLPVYEDEPSTMKGLRVEWRRTDSQTLVHLNQDGKSRAEAQQKDYQDRAHMFTDQIQRGNFSLRLDNLRAEDEGRYTCTVYSQQRSVFSVKTNLEMRLLVLVRLFRKLSQRITTIFNVLAGITFNVLPSLQFILLFYAFGSTKGALLRVGAVYVFGSVGVVLLNSVALMTELILKTVNGEGAMGDTRIIVFSSEFIFTLFLMILMVFEPCE
ncbi:Butyrophilin-like protein 2 [Labeo rohita]|uniref:Butyrophilin-like protein 2 n=1 Tax=Labeo rohita TaxID=84645 RepID=A0ABQ8MVA8_LABRO|nr:Butyrophilin-like protein 2 [Labeo rohita]